MTIFLRLCKAICNIIGLQEGFNMSQRPHSRRRNDSGSHATVHKRGSGLGGGPSGNANYNRKSGGGGGAVRAGGGLGIVAIVLFLLFGNGLGGGGGSSNQGTIATTTPTPTAQSQQNTSGSTNGNTSSLSGLFNFGTQASNQASYVNATTNAVDTTVASGSRKKYTTLKGNGKDTVTVLVYMCGTDLESKYGMGTADLSEMVNSVQSDKLNVIVETGGTSKWKNNAVTARTNQRWKIASKALMPLEKNMGAKAMTDPNTLADFIKYGVQNYPADRYILIFWDHGGGSVTGYGYDELYPNSSMSVDEIAQALKAGGTKFDIIGFDACLMANMETAIAVEPYADYLLASEETEPGTGWYHTDWLSMLAQNTSVSSLELGKKVIDDFCTKTQSGGTSGDKNTLSIIDLAEFKNTVPKKLSAFASKISEDVQNDNYQKVADARSRTKEFAQSNKLDQIDLVHFCESLNTTESKALAKALTGCVKYNRTRNVNNAYGISIYFPYRNTRYVNNLLQIYDNIDFNEEYASAVKSFATLQCSGQVYNNSTSNSLFDILGGGSVSNGASYDVSDIFSLLSGGGSQQSGGLDLSSLLGGSGAVDTGGLDLFSAFLGRSHIDSSDLVLTEKNGQQVLSLDESDWSMVQTVKLNVWVDDGTGYIDMGLDNIFEFDDDGDLIVAYDGKWLAVNDQPVSYYMLSDEYNDEENWNIQGYIPALLNDEEVHLLVEFTAQEPDGKILGAEKVYEDGMDGKLIQIEDGDVIDFICDYYDYEGNFQDRYLLNDDSLTVNGELVISDITLDNDRMLFGYCLGDIYNSDRWTPMLEY